MTLKKIKLLTLFLIALYPTLSLALCDSSPDKFDRWISDTRKKAIAKGIGSNVLDDVFSNITYSYSTINLDRNQTAFTLSFEDFLKKISASNVIETGKYMKKKHADFLKKVKTNYGVSPGILMALWGLESSFGTKTGEIHTMSALATLAYDCRRSKFFTEQFFIALELVSDGVISADTRGAAHGEIGQFQFIPSNVKRFAIDSDRDGKADLINSHVDAIESAANLLKKNGWKKLQGYQPQEKNFHILRYWNSSAVYRKAIAYIAAHIDEIPLQNGYY
ncbi:MAG: lytic transglycosylase [Candidatus Liberibacter europaeus]|uniref:Lytic transglycosylase n=1 Tax=Candidatus Liberibacter europaeus TaxID=744859 RepID=A0A2T4VXW9_9HYPH|nr:lytic transglycosylase [Candidatus Liberibacter europaeus]PTL86621.1 MAG: lytic transglycosylase [Candidatus Liberibacter europaeus]